VLAYDPKPAPEVRGCAGLRLVDLAEVFSKSDVISLHCPPPPDRKPLIDHQALQSMKPGVYLVNTARGELLDDDAVLEALESGRVAGLAVDAFRKEPPGDAPLVKHARVIATPHIGAYTRESVDRCVEAAVDNMLGYLSKS
jgi:phosphoglycerate dehydrogenase-like enzyme